MPPTLYEIALYCYLQAAEMVDHIITGLYLAFWCAIMHIKGIAEM